MAYPSRFQNNPLNTGFIVRLNKTCGRSNCKCMNSAYRHECFGLKYWYYDQLSGKRYQKIMHLNKMIVPTVQRVLSIHKGYQLLVNMGDWAIFSIAQKYPTLRRDDLYIKAYAEYGNSHNSQNWLAN